MNLSYQQIQKILDDISNEESLVKYEVNNTNKKLRSLRKRLSFLKSKKKVYNVLLKKSKVDFSGCNLTDSDVDRISSIL